MVITLLRKAYMANAPMTNYDPGVVGVSMNYKLLKKRHNWLKNPVVLGGVVIPWTILIGLLEPHSERISLAQHRYRIFLQFSTFAVVLSVATMMRMTRKD